MKGCGCNYRYISVSLNQEVASAEPQDGMGSSLKLYHRPARVEARANDTLGEEAHAFCLEL